LSSAVCLALAYSVAASAQDQAESAVPVDSAKNPNSDQSAAPKEEQEIVVTANRRSQRLQDVPASVSALTGGELEAKNAVSFADFARSVPGLSLSDSGTGRQQPSIRGVNALGVGGSTVGYYIDEAPIPATGGSLRLNNMDPSLYDLDRVEVLRGPQGTLYGSGSMGGTIKLVPRRPDLLVSEGSVRLRGEAVSGGDAVADVAGMLNVPLVPDRLAFRTTGWFRTGGGFISRYAGSKKITDVPDERTVGFRTAMSWKVTSDILAVGSVFHQSQRFNGFQSVTFGVDNPDGKLVQKFLADVPEPNDNRFTLYNLTLNGTFDAISAISSTSLYDSAYSASEESTAALNLFYGQPTPSSLYERNSMRDFSQEVRVFSNAPIWKFDWLVGGFFERQHTKRFAHWLVPGFAAFAGDDLLYLERSKRINQQKAAFGELTFHISPQLTATGGLRYFHFNSDGQRIGDGVFNGGATFTPHDASSASGVSKKGNLSWAPNRDHLFYAQYSEGFRPGFARSPLPPVCSADAAVLGIDPNATQVAPDRVKTVELGAKNSFAGRAVTANIAAYQTRWTGIQLGVFLPCGFTFSGNAGDAKIKGVELETDARLTDAVHVGGSLSYTDAKLTSVLPGTVATAGDPILGVPKWQASANAQYRFNGPSDIAWTLRADVQYTSKALLFYDTNPATAPADLSFRNRPGILLLSGRIEMHKGDWLLALYARNITNQVKIVGFPDLLTVNIADRPRFIVNRPRTIGIELARPF
jgi:outer membrane receptor protein involved in Fe transport